MGLTRPRAHQLQETSFKFACRAISTSNVTLSGGAPATVDGVSVTQGDRVLVIGQTDKSQNGIYNVATVGTGSNGTWNRTKDADDANDITAGTQVSVTEGTTYGDTVWKLTTDGDITIGTTDQDWEQASAYGFGTVTVDGTSLVADTVGDTLTVSEGTNISLSSNAGTDTFTIATVDAPTFSGNVTGGNLITGAQVVATGNITGGNIITGGLVDAAKLTVDTNTLHVDSQNNRVGIGTATPAYQVEIENTGSNALLVLDRTDGASTFIEGGATASVLGSVGANDVKIAYNSVPVVTIGAGGAITTSGNITGGNLRADNLTTENAFAIVGSDNNLIQDTTLSVDPASNYLGINQTSPEVTLHMTGEGAQTAQIRMEQYNDSADAPDVRTRRYRGTIASPSAVQSGDYLFRSNHEYYNGTSLLVGGAFAFDNTNNANRTQFSVAVDIDGTGADPAGTNGQFKIDGNDSGAITFNNAYKFPTADGSANNILATDGSGALTFTGDPSFTTVTATGNVTGGNLTTAGSLSTGLVLGNLIPTANVTYYLGNATNQWHSVFVGPGSLYINGQKVLQEDSGTIVVGADENQNISLTTTGTGDIEFNPGGSIELKGNVVLAAGKTMSQAGGAASEFSAGVKSDSVTSRTADTNLTLSANGTGVVNVNDDLTVSQNLTVTGNLTINGSTTTVSSTNTTIEDALILLVDGQSGAPTKDAGLVIDRGSSTNVAWIWDESADKFVAITTSDDATTAGDVTITAYADIQVNNITATSLSGDGSAITGIAQAQVTQHQSALSITESQISDLGSYITASSTDTLTNKSGAISQWTNDSGYLTSETYTGTVTSVAATVPTGFTVTGSPITSSGTIALAFDTGYSLPTTTSQTNWDTAYGWGDHASAGYLTSYTETNDLTAAVTWSNIPDANVPQSAVTQHQAALSITESQISDLTHYTNSDVDAHLNQTNPTSGYVLSWNGSDYAWIDNAGYADSDVNSLLASWGSNTLSTTGNITGGNLITTGLTSTGDLTVLASGTIEFNQNVLGNIGTPVSGSDATNKDYVDGLLSSVLTITDGTTSQTIADGDTLTFSGTANEVEVVVSATDTVTIGLPDDVTLGGGLTATTTVTATGNITGGNVITGGKVEATGDLETTGGDLHLKARGEIRMYDTDSSNYVALRTGSVVASNVTFNFPVQDGTSGQVLQTDGAGTLTFATASGGGGASGYQSSTISTHPAASGDEDLATGVNDDTAETPFESGAQDAFGVSLGTVYDQMEPVGSTITVDLGDEEAYVGA